MHRISTSWLAALTLLGALGAGAQTTAPSPQQSPPPARPTIPTEQPPQEAPAQPPPATHITPQQAKELFASVTPIMQFASADTGLVIKHGVKSRIITRAQVQKYLVDKMNDDKDAKRMERSEIVMKKFGLIDPDFQLRPFLVELLDEQIAAYYDSKTKTVNMLDWMDPDSQKPVLAHELTHALQDQRVNLDKWENLTSDDLSHNYASDLQHVATDEDDTAREAVVEGQAMAVFFDYSFASKHITVRNSPEIVGQFIDTMTGAGDADDPVMSRAPLLLQESLLFPYKYGLKFEATLLSDSKDLSGAYADVLDRPPDSSYEVMNPHAWEQHAQVPLLKMPDIHPVIDADYNPYDIGVMGELDVRILAQLFGGTQAEAELTPAWDGGIYYAAQEKRAANQDSTASVALLYLSQWKSPDAAADFVKMYANELSHKYAYATRDAAAETSQDEQIYRTNEGPVLIVTSGNDVFISESFNLTTARKLQLLMLGAQQQSGNQVAALRKPPSTDLTGGLVHFMSDCGMMKAALPHH
jgi:hypothetical protein